MPPAAPACEKDLGATHPDSDDVGQMGDLTASGAGGIGGVDGLGAAVARRHQAGYGLAVWWMFGLVEVYLLHVYIWIFGLLRV